MTRRSNTWSALIWLTAGAVVGTYLPRTALSNRIYDVINTVITIYPAVAHLTLISFLFFLGFKPAIGIIRRYRHNWQGRSRPFTILDGILSFAVGWIGSATLNGSLPYSALAYPDAWRPVLLMWLLGCALFLFLTLLFSFRKPSLPLAFPRIDDLVDVPITKDGEDILGRQSFVDDLYAQISLFPSEDAMVFGLNGPWGSGKTSVLNLLRNRLRNDEKIILVDFNPWYFLSAETITRRFFESIAVSINKEFFYPELRSTVRRYVQILAPILKRYGIELGQSDEATVEEVKSIVESYIVDTGRRLIVIVDDLERAHDNELVTILQIVRLSASFRNALFVLAYDQAQLFGQLGRLGISSDFLGKIVQYPIDLPAADKSEIDRFVIYSNNQGHKSHLDKLLDKLEIVGSRRNEFDKKSVELYSSRLSSFFPTLRNAKRFLIGLSVRLPVIKDEVCLLDFFLLEVLRVFANAVYQDIWTHPFYYVPPWSMKSMISSPFGLEYDNKAKDRRRERIKGHVETLLKDEVQKDNILEVLKELFAPRIADAFGRPADYGDSAAATFRAEKRLTHPESFDKYFLLGVPKGVVSDASVEAILVSWEKAQDPDKKILEDLKAYKESRGLIEILGRILIFLGRLDKGTFKPILRSISRNIETVPLDGDRSEQDIQFKLILFLLSERVSAEEKQAATEAVVRDIGSIDVAVRVVNALRSDQSSVTWELRRSLDLRQIEGIVEARFAREFIDQGVDVFKANALPLYVLYQVGEYNAESAEMVNKYAMGLLEREPKYIGKLIDGFLIEFPGGPNGFNFEQLASVYNVKRLVDLTLGAGEHAWATDKEKRAIEAFLRCAAKSGGEEVAKQDLEK
jgi:hypothetical protein